MKKLKWGLWAGAVALLGAAGLWWQGPGRELQARVAQDAAPPKAEPVLEFLPAEVVSPRREALPEPLEFSGALVAPATAVVRSRASGTLAVLSVQEGQRVRAGEPIGRIDSPEAASRLAERSAQLDAVRAALVQAERAQAQNESLAAQRFISEAALETSRAALGSARAQVVAAEAALSALRASFSENQVVAPIGGIVSRRHALPGEKVSPEQQLITLVDIGRLELAGTVGTHQVSRLKPGMVVEVQVEGVEGVRRGRVERIAPAADPGTRSIGVAVALANPGEVLRAGQFAVARAQLADTAQRLTLPEAAVRSVGSSVHVWTLDGGSLRRREVVLGRRDALRGRVEVLEGLEAGAVVLAAAFDNLKDGGRATLVAARTSGTASATPAAAAAAAAAASR